MSFLIMLLVLLAVIIIPVMIGARVVGARNTGFGAALLSVLALTLLTVVCERITGNLFLNYLIAAVLGGLVMSAILGTTFWRAIGVSIIATVIQLAIIFFFFSAAAATA